MKSPTTFFVLLATMGWVCSGLMVGPVRLAYNHRYITYRTTPRNSTVECPITLEGGDEVLEKVTWTFWKDDNTAGSFEWQPDGVAVATGKLQGVVNLERKDWYLELTSLRYDLLGYYSCAATLTSGMTKEADKWEVIIIDTTSRTSFIDNQAGSGCEFIASFKAFAVFPEPTVRSGMYSVEMMGFYEEVTSQQWIRHVYDNMSVAYSYEKLSFKIDENTPTDVEFMNIVGVTKSDNTFIPLTSGIHYNSMWTDHGCPKLRLGENQYVDYFNGHYTCRDEYKPNHGSTGKVVVTCEEGYHAEGEMQSLRFSCHDDNLTWIADQDQNQIKCVYSFGFVSSLPSLALLLPALLLSRLLQ